ncbi:MAG: hypothetical protein KC445_16705, partial [Anaerolineales bacterium]|nr:hypothetical protein [Anaerolineales bacterium]
MKSKTRLFLIMALVTIFSTGFMVPLVSRSGVVLAATPATVIDDFEDGNASDWVFFGGNNAGGGGGALSDRPQEGSFYFSTGWGGEGTASDFYGGTFKNFDNLAQVTLPADPVFNIWVLNQSNATVDEYRLEITIREDLDGNGWTNGAEDSFRFDTTFTSAAFDDQWTLISAPVSSFANQFTGGDGTFNGALDEIVIVVAGVQGAVGSTVEVDFDQISFTGGSQPSSQIIDDFENGLPAGVDGDGVSVGFITFSDGSPISIAITDAPPAPVPGAAAGNNVLAMTGDVLSFAGFVHAFENAAADAWVPQDWSSYEGFSFWLYGQNSGTTLFVDLIDNRNPGSTRDDAERFSVSFVDDFSGWKQFEFPFASFVRKDIGNGAPNDGLTLTQMHGWAFGALNTGGERTYYVDDTAVYGIAEIPDLAVTFASANYNVAEGTTGNIVVKLNRPMNSDDPAQVSVDYTTEPGTAMVAQDYLPTSGTLTFVNGGPSELSFPLETLEDSKFEGGESVILRLSNPVDVAQGFSFQAGASIQDNDAYDANLLDDFEKGAYLWDANDLAGLETQLVTATDPLAIPGQDAFETILQVSSSATAVQPLIEAVNDELDDLYPTGDFRVDLWLFLAGQQLDRSLRSAYWENDAYLDARRGSIVFSYLNVAITDLRLAGLPRNAPTAELDQLIEELMDSVAALAQNQLDLAVASGGNGRLINQAQSQIDKAERDADRGRLVTAVAYYRNAWVKAVAAMRHVEPATASFVRDFALGQDWSHGEALTFWYYGSNSGDEITVNLKENRAPDPGPSGWNMVWSEEFNDPAGTPPNPEYWSY